MILIVALVALAQVDGGTAEPVDAGVEWALPPQLPYAPDPVEQPYVAPDAGVSESAALPGEPFVASAHLSLLADRVSFAAAGGDPVSIADLRVARTFGAWAVGVNALFDAATNRLQLRDRGTNFYLRWAPPANREYSATISVHPLSMARLRIGEPPVSYGGSLPRVSFFSLSLGGGGGALGALLAPESKLGVALNAQLGRFEVHGWTQTTKAMDFSAGEERRLFQFHAGGSGRASAFMAGADLVYAPRGYFPPTLTGTQAPVDFRSVRLVVGTLSAVPIPGPVDFVWEARNPEIHLAFLPDEEPLTGFNWDVRAEASALMQQMAVLQGPPTGPVSGAPRFADQTMLIGAVRASLQAGRFRAHLRSALRPAEFFAAETAEQLTQVIVNPSTQNEYSTRLTAEWMPGERRPRLGLGAGVILPAAASNNGNWSRFREVGQVETSSGPPATVVEARATVSWQPHPLGGLVTEVKVEADPSRQASPTALFVSLLLQLRL